MSQVIAQRHQILEEFGRGGMGKVYRRLETTSKQVIVIKELYRYRYDGGVGRCRERNCD